MELTNEVMNESMLQELIELGREVEQNLAQDLFEKFKIDYLVHLQNLRALSLQSNYDQMERTAHVLNGSASTLGALKVSELCRTAEHQAANKEGIAADQINAIEKEIEVAIGYVESFLNEATRKAS